MVTSRILHLCSLCGKAFNAEDPEWFVNRHGIDCHSCEDGMIGQKMENDADDEDE